MLWVYGHYKYFNYCRSGNICEVLIFANFARRTNSRLREYRENDNINSAIKEKCKFQNQKFAKILTRENYQIYSISVRGPSLESDVYRRQILTYKIGPRTEKDNFPNEKFEKVKMIWIPNA